MSWRALAYVDDLVQHEDGTRLTAREKLVLLTLAYFHDPEHRFASPGLKEIARRSLTRRRSVIRLLKSCERHGTVTIRRFRGAYGLNETNLYYFTAFEKRDGGSSYLRPTFAKGSDTVSPPGDQAVSPPRSVTRTPTRSDTVSPNPSLKLYTGEEKPAATNPSRENPPPSASVPLPPSKQTEQEQRRKISARDRRLELEGMNVRRGPEERREGKQLSVTATNGQIDDAIAEARGMMVGLDIPAEAGKALLARLVNKIANDKGIR